MQKIKSPYFCSFIINDQLNEGEYRSIQEQAAAIFFDFIENKDYCKPFRHFIFKIYIEPTINYGRFADCADKKYRIVELTASIDQPLFELATTHEKLLLLLNSALVMLNYLSQKVSIPAEFPAEKLMQDYENYLSEKSLILNRDQVNKAVIKPFDLTKFRFLQTITNEVDNNKIHLDLNSIEGFINNRLATHTFGKSITAMDFGFELYDFNGKFAPFFKEQTSGLIRAGTKYKNYLVVKQFDYSQIKDLTLNEQHELLFSKILEGIDDFDNLKRKPKDFEKQKFYNAMHTILADYMKQLSA
jgi:hypothetical protein